MNDIPQQAPYLGAAYIPKLQRTGIIAFTDIDGTLTSGEANPSDRELADRRDVRALIAKKGIVAGAVTARTCTLTLSSASYEASAEIRELEPPPHWGVDAVTKKRVFVPLETLPFFEGCLDMDFTAAFGGHIIVRNGAGYKVDHEYRALLRYDHARGKANADPWRHSMLAFLVEKCPWVCAHFSKLESRINYDRGVTDVAPLDYRYQLEFEGMEGLAAMRRLQELLATELVEGHPIAQRIFTVDESRVVENDPEKSRYVLYLVPWGARKEKMIHQVFTRSVAAAQMRPVDVRLYYAGDTLTDLRAGLYAGGGAQFTFLLPTGSRLAPYLIEQRMSYGSEDLSFLWGSQKRRRLRKTEERGVYHYTYRNPRPQRNVIVIGDERYPGVTAPGSVAAFLDEFLVK